MRIELRDVRKSFGKQVALHGVSLVAEHRSRIALVGPNGSGKSTLLRILLGLLSCEGVVLLDGLSPFEHRKELARRVAYVPQVAPQLGATVAELLRAIAALRGLELPRIRVVGERLGLDLSELAAKPFRTLSGGTKQKVLLALALSAGASLLVLDEPTASLDAATRDRFWSYLDEVTEDSTVLLCSHRSEDVQRLVSRVVELGDGRLVRDLAAVEPRSLETASKTKGRSA